MKRLEFYAFEFDREGGIYVHGDLDTETGEREHKIIKTKAEALEVLETMKNAILNMEGEFEANPPPDVKIVLWDGQE